MTIKFREMSVFRCLYASIIGARIILGYKLLARQKACLSQEEYAEKLKERHSRAAEGVYRAVLSLQGLMIKIGQTIGSRPDLFPEEYIRVLSNLQDRVPPRPFKEIRPHMEKQLGRPVEEVFAEFDEEPVAAASLAQVYRARLKDGRDVAVKVIYPSMERLVRTDLRLLRMMIWMESRFFHFPLEPVYGELAENIPREVDMLNEARNMQEIASNLRHRPDVVIPEVIEEFTSRRVLTMEYIEGIKITDLDGMRAAGIDAERLFPLLTDVYFEQILRTGHFQADPHPGNLLALPGNRLAILDFGLAKKFTPEFREAFKKTTRAMFDGDTKGMVDGMKAQGFKLKDDDDEAGFLATGEFFRAMSDPSTYKDREVMEAVNEAWIQALKKNPAVQMPGEMALPMRVFGLLFGLGATIGDTVELGPRVIQDTLMRYAAEPEGVAAA
jgi:aarF domain-containing kinase